MDLRDKVRMMFGRSSFDNALRQIPIQKRQIIIQKIVDDWNQHGVHFVEKITSDTAKLPEKKEKENKNTMATPTPANRTTKQQAKQDDMLRSMSIERQGTKLIVPEGVELDTAIKALTLKQREEEQTVAINHSLPIEVAEGMVGFLRVLEREYGFVTDSHKVVIALL